MNDISHNILEKIKEKRLKPKPKWQFIVMNILLVISLVMSIIVGGISMSIIFLKIFNVEWDLLGIGGHPPVPLIRPPSFFILLPFLWIAILALTSWLTEKVFVRMEGGYKVHPVYIVLGSVIISLFLGGAIYHTKTADRVDESLRTFVEPYDRLEEMREKIWDLPDRGILPGQILKISNDLSFEMRDLNNSFWRVQIPSIMPYNQLMEGQMVIILGKKTGDHLFEAQEIRIKRGFFLRIRQHF